jgi:RNA polymerase sigma-70 factor (ECF subfamily)
MPPAWRVPSATIDELFRKPGAARWLTRDAFADVVEASVRRAFPAGEPSRRELERCLAGLHVEDLAIAAACAQGNEAAWDHFVLAHRPVLYRAADALDPSGGARELADSLYADLFGMRDDGEGRKSLLRYFHGRSSLATWLRAVLAQRHVDLLRTRKRFGPLPETGSEIPAATPPPVDPDRSRLAGLVVDALQAAIDALAPKDRLRLRSYYVMQLTLAQIGRITGEHEATVSRHLARTRRTLRDEMDRHLRERSHLTAGQIARAVELASADPGTLDLQKVMAGRKERPPDRSREEP